MSATRSQSLCIGSRDDGTAAEARVDALLHSGVGPFIRSFRETTVEHHLMLKVPLVQSNVSLAFTWAGADNVAAIFNEYGEAIAGISVPGTAVRRPEGELAEVGPVMQTAAEGRQALMMSNPLPDEIEQFERERPGGGTAYRAAIAADDRNCPRTAKGWRC